MKVSDEEIKEAFKAFDRDNSGTINHNEIRFHIS
jgi:Ca2+-binding EF-hand superfamily protein